jgi:hypothetical protein
VRIQQTSQRGKEYLETAEALLRAAKTMADQAISGQLKALADDYEPRAERASYVGAANALARSAADAEAKDGLDVMRSVTAQPAEKCVVNVGMPGAPLGHVTAGSFYLTNAGNNYGRRYSICVDV